MEPSLEEGRYEAIIGRRKIWREKGRYGVIRATAKNADLRAQLALTQFRPVYKFTC
jgi:hypothetical protein